MRRKTIYPILKSIVLILLFEILGFYIFGKERLVNKVISEGRIDVNLEYIDSVNVVSNVHLSQIQQNALQEKLDHKAFDFRYFLELEKAPEDTFFQEKTLAHTVYIEKYYLPLAEAGCASTILGYGEHETYRYLWLLFFWYELDYIAGRQS